MVFTGLAKDGMAGGRRRRDDEAEEMFGGPVGHADKPCER
jgi:hypothetical protein